MTEWLPSRDFHKDELEPEWLSAAPKLRGSELEWLANGVWRAPLDPVVMGLEPDVIWRGRDAIGGPSDGKEFIESTSRSGDVARSRASSRAPQDVKRGAVTDRESPLLPTPGDEPKLLMVSTRSYGEDPGGRTPPARPGCLRPTPRRRIN